jgi:SAM-dependent methyltransferase
MRALARGEHSRGLFALLSSARVFDWFQGLMGAPRLQEEFVRTYVRPESLGGGRILDVGCGTASLRDHLPSGEYFGVDVSERYLEAASRRHGRQARFSRADVRDPDFRLSEGPFDLVIMSALLHHLDDARVEALLAAAARVMAADGRLLTLDAVVTPESHPVGRMLIALDRGRHVRPLDEYHRLAAISFERVAVHVRHDLLRVPYTHVILECSKAR